MTTTKKKRFFLVSVIIFTATATAGYLLWNKPHKNIKDAVAVEMAATELYNLFTTDSLKARNLYVDKVVLVSGQVERTFVNQQSQNVILLKTAVAGAYINCTMEKKSEGIKEHDSINIKGICSGYISGDADMGLPGDVFVTRGYLLK
jgi:tRNA_anti-like